MSALITFSNASFERCLANSSSLCNRADCSSRFLICSYSEETFVFIFLIFFFKSCVSFLTCCSFWSREFISLSFLFIFRFVNHLNLLLSLLSTNLPFSVFKLLSLFSRASLSPATRLFRSSSFNCFSCLYPSINFFRSFILFCSFVPCKSDSAFSMNLCKYLISLITISIFIIFDSLFTALPIASFAVFLFLLRNLFAFLNDFNKFSIDFFPLASFNSDNFSFVLLCIFSNLFFCLVPSSRSDNCFGNSPLMVSNTWRTSLIVGVSIILFQAIS